MGGTTKSISSTPMDINQLRGSMVNWLMQGGAPKGSGAMQGAPTVYGPQITGSAQGGMQAQQTPGNGAQQGWTDPYNTNGMWGRSAGTALATGSQPDPAWAAGKAQYDSQLASGMSQAEMARAAGDPNWQSYTGRLPNFGPTSFAGQGGPGSLSPTVAGGGQVPPSQATGVDWTKGGTQPVSGPANPAFNNIFAQGPSGPVQAQGATPLAMPAQINPNVVQPGSFGQVSGPTAAPNPQVNAMQVDPNVGNPMASFMQVMSNLQNLPGMTQFARGSVRDVTAQGSGAQPTQSVDQLGGANSAFFRNMQGQLQPAFQQGRAEALAQAKEGLGNMGAGTAVANALGTAMNRSLGQEQATLADYASRGVQTEVGRQQGDAAQANQVGMANANRTLSADQGNQGADLQFLNTLLGQGQLGLGAGQQGLQAQMANQSTSANLGTTAANNALQAWLANQGANLNSQTTNASNAIQQWLGSNQMSQGAQQANMGANLQAAQGNQNAINAAQGQNVQNWMNQGQFNNNLMQNNSQFNAQMGQAYNQLAAQIGSQNAANFLNMLMGMGTTGVQGNQVVQSGGAGALLQPIAQGVGAYFGARGGS